MKGVLSLSHEQSVDEVKNHQETSTYRGCDSSRKGTHGFDIGGVEGFNLKGEIAPLLEVPKLLFCCNRVGHIQESGTSS